MNETTKFPNMDSASALFIGGAFTILASASVWPTQKAIYEVAQDTPSFSHYESSYSPNLEPSLTHQDFVSQMAEIFSKLCEGQKPLDSEFAAVWDEHMLELYES